jgi:predicted DsbA family dithiol-disulfide isomerase
VNGVPFFIIAGKYGLSGAQPAETLVEAMRQAANEITDEDGSTGQA